MNAKLLSTTGLSSNSPWLLILIKARWTSKGNRIYMECEHLPPLCEEPPEVETLKLDQVEVKSFERKSA